MTRPDTRLMRLAWLIEHGAAPGVTRARATLDEQLAQHDGWPTRGDSAGGRTSLGTSSTETAGTGRAACTAHHEQIDRDIAELVELTRALVRMCDKISRRRAIDRNDDRNDVDVPVCFEGQLGKEGNIEWGDVTCTMPPVKRGLCQHHYDLWYRHRRAHGIDVSRDHQPAT